MAHITMKEWEDYLAHAGDGIPDYWQIVARFYYEETSDARFTIDKIVKKHQARRQELEQALAELVEADSKLDVTGEYHDILRRREALEQARAVLPTEGTK